MARSKNNKKMKGGIWYDPSTWRSDKPAQQQNPLSSQTQSLGTNNTVSDNNQSEEKPSMFENVFKSSGGKSKKAKKRKANKTKKSKK